MAPIQAARECKRVVAALVTEGDRVLLCQRREDQNHPLAWELPGGKIETGEGPEQALARELGEELAVEVAVGPIWDVRFHAYPDFDVLLLFYVCRLLPNQTPTCIEVRDLRWVTAAQALEMQLLPADRPLFVRLARDGLPRFVATGATPSASLD
jgi:8-oxo-dGTP diphosphatase